MDISESHASAAQANMAPGRRDGFEFTALGVTDVAFPKTMTSAMAARFFKW